MTSGGPGVENTMIVDVESARQVVEALTSQPDEHVSTGEPIAWRRRIRPQVPGYFNWPWKTWKELTGVRWSCPSCKREDSVDLRYRPRSHYWFECRTLGCGWHRDYSYIKAGDFSRSLDVEPAGGERHPTADDLDKYA